LDIDENQISSGKSDSGRSEDTGTDPVPDIADTAVIATAISLRTLSKQILSKIYSLLQSPILICEPPRGFGIIMYQGATISLHGQFKVLVL
jgi:hypothetical protein